MEPSGGQRLIAVAPATISRRCEAHRKVGPARSIAMQQRVRHDDRRPHEATRSPRDRGPFVRARRAGVDRLGRAGTSLELASAWSDAWDRSTADLPDFRKADDFWKLGVRYAIEEY